MLSEPSLSSRALEQYLRARPRSVRWREWALGRRFRVTRFEDPRSPLVVVAHSFRDAGRAAELELAVEQDWLRAPGRARAAYEEILYKAPGIVVVQLRRTNVCGCLGHRHVVVKEAPFAESHEALGGAGCGEMDIACERIESWTALPLMDTALDAKFLEGSRLKEFHAQQYRLRLLSVLLHETNHLVFPHEPEASVRERSMVFYRDALAHYVENTIGTLSLTIDRSFSRFG